jgi:hypothetical protein
MSVHVTAHAIDRYIERIAPVAREEAYAAMISAEAAISRAAAFGAHVVRISGGAKLIITGSRQVRVVTVLRQDQISRGMYAALQQPTCCGLCGLQTSHPIASACTRTECPLGAQRRSANEGAAR